MADTGIRVTLYQLNGSGGAFITLYGTILSRQIQIIEDGSANAGVGQGLIYNLPDPNNTPGYQGSGVAGNWLGPFQIQPQTEPIILGDQLTIHQPYGAAVANGPGVIVGIGVTGATPFIQIKSASATATAVRVTEFA